MGTREIDMPFLSVLFEDLLVMRPIFGLRLDRRRNKRIETKYPDARCDKVCESHAKRCSETYADARKKGVRWPEIAADRTLRDHLGRPEAASLRWPSDRLAPDLQSEARLTPH